MNAALATAIVNAAISRTGGNAITSFTDGSVEASLANLNYEQIVKTEIEAAPWRFAGKTAACTLVVDGDGNPIPPLDANYSFAWTLPNDVLVLRTIILGGTAPQGAGVVVENYEIDQAGEILCDFDSDVLAVYIFRQDESLWPSDFTEGITCRLEAIYLRSDNYGSEADDADARADKKFARAKLTHAKEQSPRDPRRFPLIQARTIGAFVIRT